MLDLTLTTLYAKKQRKLLQSLSEKTGTAGGKSDKIMYGIKNDSGISLIRGDKISEIRGLRNLDHSIVFS